MKADLSRLKIDENTKLLTIAEAAKFANVSASTVRNWSNGPLPVFRIGRLIRVDQSTLYDFMAQHQVVHSPRNWE